MAILSRRLWPLLLVIISLTVMACSPASSTVSSAMLDPAQVQLAMAETEVTVFRSPTCGCCGAWVDHMTEAGFVVRDEMTDDMDAVKQQYGVAPGLDSCHTAVVGGYIVEGHVPATDVQRLLIEQPAVAGITAPGMPMGSPGMEQGGRVDRYTVLAFDQSGKVAAFARH